MRREWLACWSFSHCLVLLFFAQDCDMPENLKVPGNRQEGGVEDVDVMDFLNLKRAPSVKKAGSEGGVAP